MAAIGQACAQCNTLQVFATSNCEEKEGYKWTYTLGDPDSIGIHSYGIDYVRFSQQGVRDYTNGPSFRIPAGMNVIVFDRGDFAGERRVLKGSRYLTCQTLGDFAKEVGANSTL